MKLKWMSMLLLLFVLAGCGDGSTSKGVSKDQPEKATNGSEEIAEKKEENSKLAFFKDNFEEGVYQTDQMTTGLPAEFSGKVENISAAMQASLIEHDAWYMETLEKLKQGEALPYDERLGISEEDYEFLLQIDTLMVLVKVGNYEFEVRWKEQELIINNPDSKIINTLKISEDGEKIHTDLGEFTYKEEIIASDDQKATGRWSGYFYELEGDDAQLFQISIGKLEENGRLIMYTKLMKQNEEGKEEILLF